MPLKIMINIFGPPTAGKTTIAELLQKHIDRLYTVDFDVIKRQISGYYWKRDGVVARDITFDNVVSAANAALSMVVLLPQPKQQEDYERVAATAHTNGYKLYNIEITAPEEVLISRYQDRLRYVEDPAVKQRMKTIDEQTVYLRAPYYRPDNITTFDSSSKTPEAIFAAIIELVEHA